MSYGAEFKNDFGQIVISDERLITTFIGKAVFIGTVGDRMGHIHRYYIASSLRPMVFVSGIGVAVSILSVVASGSGYVIDIASSSDYVGIDVYCFAQVSQGNADYSYGMNIYDGNGVVVFSSNWKILNVRGIVTPGQLGQTVMHGVSGLAKPAAMCPCNSGQSIEVASGTSFSEWDDRDVFLITSSSITTYRTRVHYYDVKYWGVGNPPYNYGDSSTIATIPAVPFPIIDAAQYD